MEVELHELYSEENGGHDLWGDAKALTGQGGWAVCNLIIALGKVFAGNDKGVAALT